MAASAISLDCLRSQCSDLDLPHTVEQIFDRIQSEGGLLNAAQYYGSSVETYEYHKLAGRLGYIDLLLSLIPEDIRSTTADDDPSAGSSIAAYCRRVNNILRREVIDFMMTHEKLFQSRVTEADKIFAQNFDWLMFDSHRVSYLMRSGYKGKIIETPGLLHLRIVAELFHDRTSHDIAEALVCYEMSTKPYFTFASPVLFNAGHHNPNLCSCFLMTADDNLPSIMSAMYKAALVSKGMGGIGLNVSSLRHSPIGHGGMSRGIIPMLQVYDKLIHYVDQTGKRKGASTVFIQAHHIDLMSFIRASLKNAVTENHLEHLNTAIMFPDIFWERVKSGGKWTLFCPAIFRGLNESYGDAYRELYLKYETMPLPESKAPYRIQLSAQEVMEALADSQIMSGMPYVLHKDSINACSNQVNMSSPNPVHHRVIQSSNLCLEIMEQTDTQEVACCNLGQMSLKAFVNSSTGEFDFRVFGYAVRCMVTFLDIVIDRNKYIFPEAETSNFSHRPIGLGVSGYADMLNIMNIAYESEQASVLSRKIFACMYYNAMVASLELALKEGPYSTFAGSPLSEGKFAFDLWRERTSVLNPQAPPLTVVQPEEWGQTELYIEGLNAVLRPSWEDLRRIVMKHGVRNSQMIAIMPSASSSRLLGNTENTEAHQTNMYMRNFMNTSSVIINPHLFKELHNKLHLWNRDVAEFIVSQGGSVKRLPDFLTFSAETDEQRQYLQSHAGDLASLCERYKTMFEIMQLKIVAQAAERQRYVCQGISHNVYLEKPSRAMLKKLHLTTHASGLKTGMYYLREDAPQPPPEYALSSGRLKRFLTGNPMPKLAVVHHEPFPVTTERRTVTQADVPVTPQPRGGDRTAFDDDQVLMIDEKDKKTSELAQVAFKDLLEREHVEIISSVSDAATTIGSTGGESATSGQQTRQYLPEIEAAAAVSASGPACSRRSDCVSCG